MPWSAPPAYLQILWLALAVGSFVFFRFNRDGKLKRRLWPLFNLGIAALAIITAIIMRFPTVWIYVLIPIVGVITVLDIRSASFCPACGRLVKRRRSSPGEPTCPACGAKL